MFYIQGTHAGADGFGENGLSPLELDVMWRDSELHCLKFIEESLLNPFKHNFQEIYKFLTEKKKRYVKRVINRAMRHVCVKNKVFGEFPWGVCYDPALFMSMAHATMNDLGTAAHIAVDHLPTPPASVMHSFGQTAPTPTLAAYSQTPSTQSPLSTAVQNQTGGIIVNSGQIINSGRINNEGILLNSANNQPPSNQFQAAHPAVAPPPALAPPTANTTPNTSNAAFAAPPANDTGSSNQMPFQPSPNGSVQTLSNASMPSYDIGGATGSLSLPIAGVGTTNSPSQCVNPSPSASEQVIAPPTTSPTTNGSSFTNSSHFRAASDEEGDEACKALSFASSNINRSGIKVFSHPESYTRYVKTCEKFKNSQGKERTSAFPIFFLGDIEKLLAEYLRSGDTKLSPDNRQFTRDSSKFINKKFILVCDAIQELVHETPNGRDLTINYAPVILPLYLVELKQRSS